MDYNARYYSQVLGRFISPDSIVPEPGNSQAWNRYAYTLNNPLRYIDPSGHEGCEATTGCPEESSFWEDIGDTVENFGGEDLALDLVKMGVPTTIGFKGDVALGFDLGVGVDIGLDHTVAYNWYSGEFGLIEGKSLGLSLGLPQIVGFNGTGSIFVGGGATELDSFAGSSTVLYGGVQVDEFYKAGVNASVAVSTDKTGNVFYDPKSDMPVWSASLGASEGGNAFPNGVDARAGVSPGTNDSRVINSKEDLQNFWDDVTSLRYFKDYSKLLPGNR